MDRGSIGVPLSAGGGGGQAAGLTFADTTPAEQPGKTAPQTGLLRTASGLKSAAWLAGSTLGHPGCLPWTVGRARPLPSLPSTHSSAPGHRQVGAAAGEDGGRQPPRRLDGEPKNAPGRAASRSRRRRGGHCARGGSAGAGRRRCRVSLQWLARCGRGPCGLRLCGGCSVKTDAPGNRLAGQVKRLVVARRRHRWQRHRRALAQPCRRRLLLLLLPRRCPRCFRLRCLCPGLHYRAGGARGLGSRACTGASPARGAAGAAASQPRLVQQLPRVVCQLLPAALRRRCGLLLPPAEGPGARSVGRRGAALQAAGGKCPRGVGGMAPCRTGEGSCIADALHARHWRHVWPLAACAARGPGRCRLGWAGPSQQRPSTAQRCQCALGWAAAPEGAGQDDGGREGGEEVVAAAGALHCGQLVHVAGCWGGCWAGRVLGRGGGGGGGVCV